MKNWWYYHKWYVICGGILLGIIFSLVGNALGLFQKFPDVQIAYVGTAQLPPDTASALESAFASIAGDFNGDGEVIVHLNQYIKGNQTGDAEMSYYEYASELTLIGDISDCESYFFLMEDPADFQRSFQLLANPDGSCPEETDHSAKEKAILWSECPVLPQMEPLSNLYIGRRCFYTDKRTDCEEDCRKLWDFLTDKQK